MADMTPEQDEAALQYLRERNIPGLVEDMIEHLVGAKPNNPVAALKDFLASVDQIEYCVPGTIASKPGGGGLGMDNLLMLSDSYKFSHYLQYPPKTTTVYSYFESRGGKYAQTCFFGLQYFLKKHLAGVVVTPQKIAEAKHLISCHLPPTVPFNLKGWERIWEKHGGRLPIIIKAIPEGTLVDTKNVLFTMENTDPECYWLTNFLETLLVQVWYPMTVATHSRACVKKIYDNLMLTSDDPHGEYFYRMVDFGFRGVSSCETAALGGAAHLLNSTSSDTIAGLVMLRDYYSAEVSVAEDGTQNIPGTSLPASEHSTITAWGKDREVDAMANMLEQYPCGPVACVSDSYDIFKACSEYWGEKLKDKVLARDGNLIVRPDSGDVIEVSIKVMELLWAAFGGTTNSKGFKVLDKHVRVLWGDGVDHESLGKILDNLREKGWAGDNISFGSGGGLLQKLHRDTQKCAFKCSSAIVDGQDVEVYKQPITDPGKVSKKGRLSLHNQGGTWVTKMGSEYDQKNDQLVEVFRDGEITKEYTFSEVKSRAKIIQPSQ